MTESILSPRALVRTERTKKALQLRKAGVSLSQIAEQIGMANASGPWKLIKEALDELRRECKEEADQLRQMQLERLNDMLTIYWPKMTKAKDEETGRLVLKILNQIDDLMGLKAPIKMQPVLPPVAPRQVTYDVDINKLSLEQLSSMREIMRAGGVEVIENPEPEPNGAVAQAIMDAIKDEASEDDTEDDDDAEDQTQTDI